MEEPYIFHFPDGNASLARLIVRSLIPGVAPGTTMADVVTARFDYGRLDEPGAPIRLRLRSTVVHVRNADGGVDLRYVRDGAVHRIRAGRCVLAGYHMMIPAIMPELPDEQRVALWQNVKAPLCDVKVARARLEPVGPPGRARDHEPDGLLFEDHARGYPVSIARLPVPGSPDEPTVLHLVYVSLRCRTAVLDTPAQRPGRRGGAVRDDVPRNFEAAGARRASPEPRPPGRLPAARDTWPSP